PIFPDENEHTVTADNGIADPVVGARAESDEVNEPADIAFVLRQVAALDGPGSDSKLTGALDLQRIALAGQSDGADVVASLAFDSADASSLAALPSRPRAVAVLSGSEFAVSGQSYSADASSPPLLMVESDADECNFPQGSLGLYEALSGDASRAFVELLGADHLGPYMGTEPFADVVDNTTRLFFELHLGWRSGALRQADLVAAADVAGVSHLSYAAPEIPSYTGGYVCPPPPSGG
ncbi:MAG: hypothetical protein ACRD0B_05300, partial [Acidimicrobiales bacterium]